MLYVINFMDIHLTGQERKKSNPGPILGNNGHGRGYGYQNQEVRSNHNQQFSSKPQQKISMLVIFIDHLMLL